MLTERQKEILEQGGLPADYEKLAKRQKRAITAIEEMLAYLEKKYGKQFVYMGYVPGELLEEEHLIAYPADGAPKETVTVWRDSVTDGEETAFYDDYSCLLARPWYQAAVKEYFAKNFPDGTYMVNAEVTGTDGEVAEDTVIRNASAKLYVLIDESVCTQQRLNEFTASYGSWMKEQSGGHQASSTSIYLVAGELMNKANEANRESVIFTGKHSGQAACSVSADGGIHIF